MSAPWSIRAIWGGCLVKIRAKPEVFEMVSLRRCWLCVYYMLRLILSIYELWQSQDARRIRSSGIAAEFPHHLPLKRLCLTLGNPFDLPNDLILFWGCLKDVVGPWHQARIFDCFQS